MDGWVQLHLQEAQLENAADTHTAAATARSASGPSIKMQLFGLLHSAVYVLFGKWRCAWSWL
jgi:hypothetical protein